MRTPRYLSPTSIKMFYADREQFYLQYLADNRPPRFAQTPAMSVGSAFDAYVKCYLADRFDIEFVSLDELLSLQVEEANLSFATSAGEACFLAYQRSGALANLMLEIESFADPGSLAFESTVRGEVSGADTSIPLLGKPDMHYTCSGVPVVLDWKVNGYCSSSNTSPSKGYIRCLDGWDHSVTKASRSHGKSHSAYQPLSLNGVTYNAAISLADINADWAAQTCIYSWLLGCEVGSDFIIGIDQLACGAGGDLIRVATFRSMLSSSYQTELYRRAAACWEAIASADTVFIGWEGIDSADASSSKCAELDTYYLAYSGDDGDAFAGIL